MRLEPVPARSFHGQRMEINRVNQDRAPLKFYIGLAAIAYSIWLAYFLATGHLASNLETMGTARRPSRMLKNVFEVGRNCTNHGICSWVPGSRREIWPSVRLAEGRKILFQQPASAIGCVDHCSLEVSHR